MTINNKIELANPLPISKGGTGATSAAQGRTNLAYSVANTRNFIRGGNFDTNPWQRSRSLLSIPYATDIPSDEYFTLDANQCYFAADGFFLHPYVASTTGEFTMSQVNSAPTFGQCGMNVQTSLYVSSPAGGVTSNANNLIQLGQILDVQQGSPLAGEWTLSFWVRASQAGTYSLTIGTIDSTYYTNLVTYTINNALTWEFKSITFSSFAPYSIFQAAWIDGISSFGYSSAFPCIFWNLNSGSSWYQTPNTGWHEYRQGAGVSGQVNLFQSVGDFFQLALVQAEVGPTATNFAYRTAADELTYAQRFYEKSYKTTTNPGSITRTNVCWMVPQVKTTSYYSDYLYLKAPKPYYCSTIGLDGLGGGRITIYSADHGTVGNVSFLQTPNPPGGTADYPVSVNVSSTSPQNCTTLFELSAVPTSGITPTGIGYYHYTVECEPGLYYGY